MLFNYYHEIKYDKELLRISADMANTYRDYLYRVRDYPFAYPSDYFSDIGIICLIARRHIPSILGLRESGIIQKYFFPIEFWYQNDNSLYGCSGDKLLRTLVHTVCSPLSIELVNASKHMIYHPFDCSSIYSLSCYASVFSRFNKVIFLSFDDLINGDFLSTLSSFSFSGSTLFGNPRDCLIDNRVFSILGISGKKGFERIDMRGFYLDKSTSWGVLQLAMHIYDNFDYYRHVIDGDIVLLLSFLLRGSPYFLERFNFDYK